MFEAVITPPVEDGGTGGGFAIGTAASTRGGREDEHIAVLIRATERHNGASGNIAEDPYFRAGFQRDIELDD
jgi:hypothetical protein